MAATIMQHGTYTVNNGKQVGSIACYGLKVDATRANKRHAKKLACQRRWLIKEILTATTRERLESLWYKASGQGHIDLCKACEVFIEKTLG